MRQFVADRDAGVTAHRKIRRKEGPQGLNEMIRRVILIALTNGFDDLPSPKEPPASRRGKHVRRRHAGPVEDAEGHKIEIALPDPNIIDELGQCGYQQPVGLEMISQERMVGDVAMFHDRGQALGVGRSVFVAQCVIGFHPFVVKR